MKKPLFITKTQRLCMILMLAFTPVVAAVHLDVEVWGEGDALFAGYCRTPGVVGCDLDGLLDGFSFPEGSIPVEAASGKLIFLADFQDLSGGQYKTKNPGFQSIQNALLPNELLSYRALGNLRFWSPESSAWAQAPQDGRIALYGGLEASAGLATDYNACAGQLLCFDADNFNTDNHTLFSAEGISGSRELVVDITSESGILHTHLSFFLENQQGETGGPIGAYLIEIQVFSNARSTPTQPFLILFNAGLSSTQMSEALAALIKDANDGDRPLPGKALMPISILGDVDLDGDVDRIDVALILLAEQNNTPLQFENIMFDLDHDALITRQDAELAKSLCNLRLCQVPSAIQAEPIEQLAFYDEQTEQIVLNDVQIDQQHYRAILQQSDQGHFSLISVQPTEVLYALPAHYDVHSSTLEISVIYAQGRYYQATLQLSEDLKFQLKSLKEIDNFIK